MAWKTDRKQKLIYVSLASRATLRLYAAPTPRITSWRSPVLFLSSLPHALPFRRAEHARVAWRALSPADSRAARLPPRALPPTTPRSVSFSCTPW